MSAANENPIFTVLETKASQERAACLAAYIRDTREICTAAGTVRWSDDTWPGLGVFTNLENTRPGRQPKEIDPSKLLDNTFIEFAKAYIWERHSCNPGGSRGPNISRLAALRVLEATLKLLHKTASPLQIDRNTLDQAASSVRNRFTVKSAEEVGIALQHLAQVTASKGILPLDVKGWEHPLHHGRLGRAVGKDGDLARASKLPNEASIKALAAIFNRQLDPSDKRVGQDIFTTSVTALLFAAPSRVSQIIRLPIETLGGGENGESNSQLALRVGASKNFEPHLKWIIDDMKPAVEKAIKRVQAMTEEGRRLARHYEDPARRHLFYRHQDCPDVDEHEPLTPVQVCQALGLHVRNSPITELRRVGLDVAPGETTLHCLWKHWVLPQHKKNCPFFPYISKKDRALGSKGGLKFSEALFCMRRSQLSVRARTSPVLLVMPTSASYTADVCVHSTAAGRGRKATIFERYNYTDEEGNSLGFRSHQARHMINTEAQRSTLPDELIARWSGRQKVDQNEVYDHRSTQERVEQSRAIVAATASTTDMRPDDDTPSFRRDGPWLVVHRSNLRSCGDLEDIEPQLTGLQTMYGECYHDYASSPCEGFIACLECKDHDCIKGSDADATARIARIEDLKRRAEAEILKCRVAAAAGDWGVDEWRKVQEAWAAKLSQLLIILRDPSVPDGARIRLAGTTHPTHLHRALRGLARQAVDNQVAPKEVIEQMLLAIEPKASTTQIITECPQVAPTVAVNKEE